MTDPGFDYYNWLVLPFLIFFSRIFDVTLGTIRHVFIAKGFKQIVPVLGFFEVLIWIVVVKQIMNGANTWPCYVAWAGGFAAGNFLGLLIEERLALGLQIIRIITNQDCQALVEALRNANHGVTIVDGQGAKGQVKLIFTVLKRDNMGEVEELIAKYNPTAFYSVEDIKDTSMGVFRSKKERANLLNLLFSLRKSR
jgi:uncharacterized protein YebE (UPF0316 family)